ncbi:MAG: uroporphyrinogen-III C-methyltransferase [Gammaproteobacteria bacterium]|jgi:uncharacterized protein HemX
MNDSRSEDPREGAPETKAPEDAGTAAATPANADPDRKPAADPAPGPAREPAPSSDSTDTSPELGDTVAPEPPHEHPAESQHKEHRGGGGLLALLALVVALAAAGGAIYLYLLQHEGQAARETAVQRVEATERLLADLRAEEAALQRRLAGLEETQAERRQALTLLEQELDVVRGRLQSLEQVETGPERAPSLAELEYLLLIADRELQLADNPRVALAALREADRRLARMDEPALAGARAALNDEIAAVEAVAGVDRAGIALRLDSLAGRIEGLPLRGSLAPPLEGAGSIDDAGASGWDRFVSRVRGAAAGLFRIRRSDEPATPLLAPDESFFLYRNVELDLKSARLAALARDAANYSAGLAGARAALGDYFQADDPAVAAVLEAITELQGRDVEPQWPEISRSLTLLRAAGAGE